MADGRRHSVDIPLSKTLMTLKRVRSLRDPSTISMSKFIISADNVKLDANALNEVVQGLKDPSLCDHTDGRLFCSDGRREDRGSDPESEDDNLKLPSEKLALANKCSKQQKPGYKTKPSDSTWIPNSNKHFEEDVNSYSEPNLVRLKRTAVGIRRKKSGPRNIRKVSAMVEDAAMSPIDSPYMSLSEACSNRSHHSLSAVPNEEANATESNYSGCGLSSCWSRTPKFKDLNRYSDVEDQDYPLLPAGRRELTCRETPVHLESPRSLGQKYRPKSFDQLVGQHVVAQSLMNAISRGKLSPIYLFHGPRGTGKTSMARIFAAALNCLSLEAYRPCGFCRECVFLFSGRSRDVKELDGSKINRKDRIKSLVKSVSVTPYSPFKVFIVDECQCLPAEAWSAILNCLEEIRHHVVFIMITSEADKLPRSSVSRCQRYHFPKIKDADIVSRLQKICVEEVLDFDKEALDFIAAKCNGSLRDAEIMLDQLSLLGKKITLPVAYELVGVISDDELLDLLDLALSSDTANTVRRARELMSSKVDPMQLISQLANIIMDILAGKCQSRCSEAERNFSGRHTLAEVSLQKLRRALKILSDTEKQLRASKNQATWLTVALLQFSSEDSFTDVDDPKTFPKLMCLRGADIYPYALIPHFAKCINDDGLCCIGSPTRESHRGSCDHGSSRCSEQQSDSSRKLEAIWRRTVEKCQTDSFRSFLLKEGKLSAIHVSRGLAIAEIQFFHAECVPRAKKLWKQIAGSLQLVLGCNVEIRISLASSSSKRNFLRRKLSFDFLSCAGWKREKSESGITGEQDAEIATSKEGFLYTDDYGQNLSPVVRMSDGKLVPCIKCSHRKDIVTIEDTEGNVLSAGIPSSEAAVHHPTMHGCCNVGGSDASIDNSEDVKYIRIQDSKGQPCCFPNCLTFRRKFHSSEGLHIICTKPQCDNKSDFCNSDKGSSERSFCPTNGFVLCAATDSQMLHNSAKELSQGDGVDKMKFRCWGAPKTSLHKVYKLRHSSQPSSWIPCFQGKASPLSDIKFDSASLDIASEKTKLMDAGSTE